MTKEEKIQEYNRNKLIEELSKMPSMVIATAYLHAINYTLYGEDVTQKCGEKTIMLKMELGEQADILYHLLTEQMTKAEIKAESEGK